MKLWALTSLALIIAGCAKQPLPPWMKPGVRAGSELIAKRPILQPDGNRQHVALRAAGAIDTLTIAVAKHGKGVTLYNAQGTRQAHIAIPIGFGDELWLIEADGDSSFEFLRESGDELALLDDDGSKKWAKRLRLRIGSEVTRLAESGEHVIARSFDKVHVINSSGQQLWESKQPGALYNAVALRIDDNDWEVLTAVHGTDFLLLDKDGKRRRSFRISGERFVSDWTAIAGAVEHRGQPLLLIAGERQKIAAMDGTIVQQLPGGYVSWPIATLIKLKVDEPPYLAVLGNLNFQGNVWMGFQAVHSQLTIYDSQGRLVYEEVLDNRCDSMLPVASPDGKEHLIVGGDFGVFQYSAAK